MNSEIPATQVAQGLGTLGPAQLARPQCFICFGSETGKRWKDHFVRTLNGHPFHYCCIRFMMVDGISTCPACDEDLRHQTLTPIPVPAGRPGVGSVVPDPHRQGTSSPVGSSKSTSSMIKNVVELLSGNGKGTPFKLSTIPSRLSLDGTRSHDTQKNTAVDSVPISPPCPAQDSPRTATGSGIERQTTANNGNNTRLRTSLQATEPTAPPCPNDFASSDFQPQPPMATNPHVSVYPALRTVPSRAYLQRTAGFPNQQGTNHLQISDHNVVTDIPPDSMQPDFTFKIAILGDSAVGKSALLRCFADEPFNSNLLTTIGCDLRVKTIEVANKSVRLNLWDTGGQERFRQALVGNYLRNTDGIVLCFDITNVGTLASIQEWNNFAFQFAPHDVATVLVGNKADLWGHRDVEDFQALEVAGLINRPYLLCSAKDAFNVEVVFRTLASQILEKRMTSNASPRGVEGIVHLNQRSKKKKNGDCC